MRFAVLRLLNPCMLRVMENYAIVSHTDLLLYDETNEVSTGKP